MVGQQQERRFCHLPAAEPGQQQHLRRQQTGFEPRNTETEAEDAAAGRQRRPLLHRAAVFQPRLCLVFDVRDVAATRARRRPGAAVTDPVQFRQPDVTHKPPAVASDDAGRAAQPAAAATADREPLRDCRQEQQQPLQQRQRLLRRSAVLPSATTTTTTATSTTNHPGSGAAARRPGLETENSSATFRQQRQPGCQDQQGLDQ